MSFCLDLFLLSGSLGMLMKVQMKMTVMTSYKGLPQKQQHGVVMMLSAPEIPRQLHQCQVLPKSKSIVMERGIIQIAPLIKLQIEAIAEATRHHRKMEELKQKELEMLIIDPKIPDIRQEATVSSGHNWSEFYAEACEDLPNDMLTRLSKQIMRTRKGWNKLNQKELELAHKLSLLEAHEKVDANLSNAMIRNNFLELVKLIETDTDE